MPWAGNIAKTMTSNGKQFTVTREMLTTVARDHSVRWRWPDVVARISARISKLALAIITNHLMTGPLENSDFCFPRITMFSSTSSRETLRFSGNKIHCSPREQSLSVKYNSFLAVSWAMPPCFQGLSLLNGCKGSILLYRVAGYQAQLGKVLVVWVHEKLSSSVQIILEENVEEGEIKSNCNGQ